MEKWKDIPGWEGRYQISSYGRIKSLHFNGSKKPKILECTYDVRGYRCIAFRVGGAGSKQKHFMVHRLVAKMLIPNPQGKPFVNHKDGDRKNNDVSNLEWVTKEENEWHKLYVLGSVSGACIPPKKIVCVETRKEYPSISAAAKAVGVSQGAISNALRGKTKTSAGFHWRYA